jgi:signal transduction histidine kinase
MALPSIAIELTVWNLLMLIGAVLGLAVSAMFLRRGRRRLNLILATAVTAAALWAINNVIGLSVTDPASEAFWISTAYIWIPTVTVAWLLFGMEYSDYAEYVNWKTIALLALHPAIVATAALTNSAHHLFWTESGAPGLLWITHALLSYVELLAGTGLVLQHIYRDESVYRMQALVLAVGVMFPTVLNATFLVTGLVPNDPTPLGFAVTGLALLYGMRSYDLGDVTPIAKSVVVDNLNDGLIIVDDDGRITEINDEARDMLRIATVEIGDSLSEVLEHAPGVVELGRAEENINVEVDVELPTDPTGDLATDGGSGERHTFEFEVTPVRDQRESIVGRLYQFRDITERVERERELELQNQQLDNFVAAISRNIRDPMEELDEQIRWAYQHTPETEQRLRRVLYSSSQHVDEMGTTLEELVDLAREGSVVREEDMGRVSLADTVDEAWYDATGREGSATLSGVPDVNVYADRDRLERILTNLLDNAVVHGGDAVTVEVGVVGDEADPDGFYVEDDGLGVRPMEEDPFSPGVTTEEDRPGVGLAVVSTGVEAHGWDVEVADGPTGGARVEITDVDFPKRRLSDNIGALVPSEPMVEDGELGAD